MATVHRITDEQTLLRELRVSSLSELEGNPKAQEKFGQLLPEIDHKLALSLINTVPSIAKGVGKVCEAAASVSKHLSEVQRERWRTVGKIAEDQRFTPDHIMELVHLITETERAEGRQWTDILKGALLVLGTVAVIFLAILFPPARRALSRILTQKARA